MPTEEAYQERKQKFDDKVQAVKDQLNELKDKLNAVDLKDRRKSKYLNEIDNHLKTVGEWAFGGEGVKICPASNYGYNLWRQFGQCTPAAKFAPQGAWMHPGTNYCTPYR